MTALVLYDLLVAAAILLAGLGLGSLAMQAVQLAGARETGWWNAGTRGEGVDEAAGADTRAPFLGLWLSWVLGLGLLSLLTLGFAAGGLLRGVVAVPLVGSLAIVGGVAFGRGVAAGVGSGALRPYAMLAGVDRSFVALFLLMAAGSLVWILFAHTLLPPTDWDTISYHLALPQLYVDAGRITYVNFMLHANWPMNMEMLFALALLLGSDVATHLTMLGFLVLTAAGMLIAARRLLGDDRVGAIAVLLLLTVPMVKRLGGLAMIDVAIGLYVLAAGVAFARWRDTRGQRWLLLCGLFCGFAAGSKLMGGGFAILYGLLVLWEQGKGWLAARKAGQGRAYGSNVVRQLLVLVLAGLAMVGPWYLRSTLNTGNPIWPFAFHVFGGRDWDELGDEYNMQLMLERWAELQLPRNPIGLLQSYGYMLLSPNEISDFRGGLGQPLMAGALLALLGMLLFRDAPPFVRQSLFVCAGFWMLWFFLVSHQVRFLLPALPLLALASGWAVVRLLVRRRTPNVRAAAFATVALVALLEWPWYYAPERALLLSRLPYLRGEQTRAAFIDAHVDVMPYVRFANAELPADARLLLLPYETRGYYLERDYIWAHPASQRVIRFEQHPSAEALLATLQGIGITHLLEHTAFLYEELRYWDRDRALMLDLEARCATPLFTGERGALLRLDESCRPAAAGVETP